MIGQRDRTPDVELTLCLPLHQHPHPVGQKREFAFLAGNDIGQILDGAGQMGDLFFKGGVNVGHGCLLTAQSRRGNWSGGRVKARRQVAKLSGPVDLKRQIPVKGCCKVLKAADLEIDRLQDVDPVS